MFVCVRAFREQTSNLKIKWKPRTSYNNTVEQNTIERDTPIRRYCILNVTLAYCRNLELCSRCGICVLTKSRDPFQLTGNLESRSRRFRWLAVVLAVVGVCSAVPFIQDTPEVAAEKARFFQAFQAAQQTAAPQQHHNFIPHQAHNTFHHMAHHHQAQFTPKWTGPVAATVPAGVDGTVTPVGDTADVSAARQAFFNAYQAQLSATVGAAPAFPHAVPAHVPAHTFNAVHAAPAQPKWTGPVAATVPAGLPGSTSQVADTPEVQAAKAAFFQTFQRQVAAAAPPAPAWG
ncbi:cuticle protein CP1876-like isoform X1 [Macrobrachium rosenbergii]|uniref:cuticle protein CP1876-like isoform X1 n=1 Tax=Macrobrachium rosenbergii TaxID=79674 RepID=UPI0034D4D288